MVEYFIDKNKVEIEMNPPFSYGSKEILCDKENDISFDQDWHKEGFFICDLFDKKEFNNIKKGISNCIFKTTNKKFKIEKYHNYVDEKKHFEIVEKSRDLYPKDFEFSVPKILNKLSNILGFELTDFNPFVSKPLHIIVRIVRPNSKDFNPPHKDIHEEFDRTGVVPKHINFWIPICGVGKNSMLPIAPKSHLIPENKILRTFQGSNIGKNKYRVNGIVQWNEENKLIRPKIKYGQVLIFSSHLIHGCATNNQKDTTRISLEFRLFKK